MALNYKGYKEDSEGLAKLIEAEQGKVNWASLEHYMFGAYCFNCHIYADNKTGLYVVKRERGKAYRFKDWAAVKECVNKLITLSKNPFSSAIKEV